MALRVTIRGSVPRIGGLEYALEGFRRWNHAEPQAAPLQTAVFSSVNITMPPLVSPENQSGSRIGTLLPRFSSIGGSMELMAVPKRKVTPHKKGIRNGPKALKPIPVIIRCKACGKVKLPHFYCCSGIKPNQGNSEHNG